MQWFGVVGTMEAVGGWGGGRGRLEAVGGSWGQLGVGVGGLPFLETACWNLRVSAAWGNKNDVRHNFCTFRQFRRKRESHEFGICTAWQLETLSTFVDPAFFLLQVPVRLMDNLAGAMVNSRLRHKMHQLCTCEPPEVFIRVMCCWEK